MAREGGDGLPSTNPKPILMKKLDKLMLRNFMGPYVVTFFIALFVLVLQTLWVYIDEIAGKGIGIFILVELIAYMSVSMFPLALPLAVLISSVMVLGDLAEHYELSSFKSAGISLWRVMQPLFFASVGVALFSIFCANNLIPVSNLKFRSRLYDIREQKPALNLEAGVFNDDFKGYSLFIGEKGSDNRHIKDIIVIDHTKASSGQMLELLANEGEMFVTDDKRNFVLRLSDGWQYQEPKSIAKDEKHPFIRVSFKSWEKVFDLSEFELSRTDENLFRSHETMLNTRQLIQAIDSVNGSIDKRILRFGENAGEHFTPIRREMKKRRKPKKQIEEPRQKEAPQKETEKTKSERQTTPPDTLRKTVPSLTGGRPQIMPRRPAKTKASRGKVPKQIRLDQLDSLHSIIETFPPNTRTDLIRRAKTTARSILAQTESALRSIELKKEARTKYLFQLHSKYSLAAACILFLFIGAPMGAIVRKGGFGYPMLISIVFFMVFMILTILGKNIAERGVIDPALAAWLPNLVLFPIGLLLTYQAMNGYKTIVSSKLLRWWYKVRGIQSEN